MPPFTRSTWPVTHLLAAEHKNAIVLAISSGSPRRPNGMLPEIAFRTASGLPLRNKSVAVGPGATALTLIPLEARSLARTRVICSIAPLVLLYSRYAGLTMAAVVNDVENSTIWEPVGM